MTNKIETRPNSIRVEDGKTIFDFTSSERPTISDYTSLYAPTYGQYPNVRCIITIDENNGSQSMQNPLFKYKDGLIEDIFFDIKGTESCCLVLS